VCKELPEGNNHHRSHVATALAGAQIKAAILGSTVATPSLAGRTATGGRLNVGEF
jgi:hypothetical protein